MNFKPDEPPAPIAASAGLVERTIAYFKGHPKGFWFIFWGEFAERCSYYGMRAILAKYMADQLNLGQDNAAMYMSYFFAAVYFLPLLGGWIADNLFGKYWTIVGFSVPYILGHVILGIESFPFLLLALALLAMGSGIIKPNIPTLMGLTYDQQRPGQTKLRSDAFAIFYLAVNIGAAISMFAMPTLRSNYSYRIAFLFPAGLMMVAFAVFAAGKRYYAVEPPPRLRRPAGTAEVTETGTAAERWRVLGRLFGLFFLVMFFWAVFDQNSITWVYFTEACMDRHILGTHMDADHLQFLNAIFIMAILPPITLAVNYLQARGWRIRATDKMVAGFWITAACMGVMALAARLAGTADLRPGVVSGNDVTLTVGGPTPFQFQGQVKVTAAEPDLITIALEKRATGPADKAQIDRSAIRIEGAGLLKLVADGDERVRVEGPVRRIEHKPATGDMHVLSDGPATVTTAGKLDIGQRWFVAPENQVTVWWLVIAYIVLTVAEILISVTGLELAYAAAPQSMTGFVTACWLLTVSLANLLINAPITRLYTQMQPAAYFGMLTGIMVVVSIAFLFQARRFNRGQPATASPNP